MKKPKHYIVDENGPLIVDEDLHFMLTNPDANKILVDTIQEAIDKEIIETICKKAKEGTQE